MMPLIEEEDELLRFALVPEWFAKQKAKCFIGTPQIIVKHGALRPGRTVK